ncbi:MAG: histidine phosphatase family protein [Pseudomonadales bacterium]|nr:histidine phosphatase family protein [Pseudomonadales bacterium]
MKQVFLLRHGETEWNVAQEMQLRLASPLTENGKRQPDKNGRLLKKHGCLECLCASPSGRTLETAYTVNAYAQAELVTREELMERDMGDWSRLTHVTHGLMSKVILTYYLGLALQPVHSLRHPNNLA